MSLSFLGEDWEETRLKKRFSRKRQKQVFDNFNTGHKKEKRHGSGPELEEAEAGRGGGVFAFGLFYSIIGQPMFNHYSTVIQSLANRSDRCLGGGANLTL